MTEYSLCEMKTSVSNAVFQELSVLIEKDELYKQPRLSISELSELTGLSSKDISQAFNLSAGMNFNRYINLKRLKTVISSLNQESRPSILYAALEAGFNSKSSFNLVFKKEFGISPSQFVKQAKDCPEMLNVSPKV